MTQTFSLSLGTQTFTFGVGQFTGDGPYRYWLPFSQKKRDSNSYGKPKIVGPGCGLKCGWKIQLNLTESDWTPLEAAIARYFKYFDSPTNEIPDWVLFDTNELWTESTVTPTRYGTAPITLPNGLLSYFAAFAARLNTDSNWFEVAGGKGDAKYFVNLNFTETYAFLPDLLGNFLDLNAPLFSQGGSGRISGSGAGSISGGPGGSSADQSISSNGSGALRGAGNQTVAGSGNWIVEGYSTLVNDIGETGSITIPASLVRYSIFSYFNPINCAVSSTDFSFGPITINARDGGSEVCGSRTVYDILYDGRNPVGYGSPPIITRGTEPIFGGPPLSNACNFSALTKNGPYDSITTTDVSSQNPNGCKATDFYVNGALTPAFRLYGPYTIRNATTGQLAAIQ